MKLAVNGNDDDLGLQYFRPAMLVLRWKLWSSNNFVQSSRNNEL